MLVQVWCCYCFVGFLLRLASRARTHTHGLLVLSFLLSVLHTRCRYQGTRYDIPGTQVPVLCCLSLLVRLVVFCVFPSTLKGASTYAATTTEYLVLYDYVAVVIEHIGHSRTVR